MAEGIHKLLREDLSGFPTIAMLDLPNTLGNVNSNYAARWGMTPDQVLNRGVANSVREPDAVQQAPAATAHLGGHFLVSGWAVREHPAVRSGAEQAHAGNRELLREVAQPLGLA